jgi:hypothetical protein
LACAITFHVSLRAVWVGGLVAFGDVRTVENFGSFGRVPLMFLMALGFMAGVFIPSAYLYALYRLIRMIDETSKKA